jgi:metal-sulfur cluster biosynthetic enzyme
MPVSEASVLDALKIVNDPDLHRDIVSLGFIKDSKIEHARVSFTIELTTPACPEGSDARWRAAVLQVPGVSDVDIRMSAARKPWASDSTRSSIGSEERDRGSARGGAGRQDRPPPSISRSPWSNAAGASARSTPTSTDRTSRSCSG